MDLQTLLAKGVGGDRVVIYVEPDTTKQVSARFKNTPSGEALKLLLGDLNFTALVLAMLLPDCSCSVRHSSKQLSSLRPQKE
jgi:hypothetical protein